MCDHIRTNKMTGWGARKWHVNPPKFPEESEIEMFAEDLIETSQKKIVEFLDRYDEVEESRKVSIRDIQQRADAENWDETSEWFWTYLENYKYTEVLYIEKWLKYWSKIYEVASKKQFMPVHFEQKEEVGEDDVSRAKEYPIEDMYDGELKSVYGRLQGLCPFHDEKTPSFSIFTNDNHYYCFGCHAWGDAIDFYMKKNGVNLIEAVKAINGK